MNINNIETETLKKLKNIKEDIRKIKKQSKNTETNEEKILVNKAHYEHTIDYVFQLFGESEELTARNNKLKQQLENQQAMIEQLERKLAAIGTILAKEADAVTAEN